MSRWDSARPRGVGLYSVDTPMGYLSASELEAAVATAETQVSQFEAEYEAAKQAVRLAREQWGVAFRGVGGLFIDKSTPADTRARINAAEDVLHQALRTRSHLQQRLRGARDEVERLRIQASDLARNKVRPGRRGEVTVDAGVIRGL